MVGFCVRKAGVCVNKKEILRYGSTRGCTVKNKKREDKATEKEQRKGRWKLGIGVLIFGVLAVLVLRFRFLIFPDTAAGTAEARLLYVVDGDTIAVELDGEKEYVRLLFINAPESVHPVEEKNNRFGEEASAYAKRLFEGVETVYLEYEDAENNRDAYGRLLAFVWLRPVERVDAEAVRQSLVNAVLVADGYAFLHIYDNGNPVNEFYRSVFEELFEDARAQKAGLWADKAFGELYEEQE